MFPRQILGIPWQGLAVHGKGLFLKISVINYTKKLYVVLKSTIRGFLDNILSNMCEK